MKTILTLITVLFITVALNAQNSDKPYDPNRDAEMQIEEAVAKAKKEGKHVFLQIGGNWCSWCLMMHNFYTTDQKVDSAMQANYVVEMINYSKENRNSKVLQQLGFPQRFGFPVIVILDADGNRIHTQNTVCLEEGRGYSQKRFLSFLQNWSPAALDPQNYKK
jgi:thioredoxin-related protein